MKEKVIAESVRQQVMTELTAFLCVDKDTADNQLHSIRAGKKTTYNIKAMRPGDMQVNVDDIDDDEDSDIYEDECAIASFETGNYKIPDKTEFKTFHKPYRPILMFKQLGSQVQSINGAVEYVQIQRRNMIFLIRSQ